MKKLRKEEVIAYWKERRERRARILEERRNGAFAQKMKPVYQFMNRFSLIFHALLACPDSTVTLECTLKTSTLFRHGAI